MASSSSGRRQQQPTQPSKAASSTALTTATSLEPESQPTTDFALPQYIIDIAVDFLDRYIEDRRQNKWGYKEKTAEFLNSVTKLTTGYEPFHNTPNEKLKKCSEINGALKSIHTPQDFFNFINKLGEEADKADSEATANASILFYILHAIRSLLISYVKANLKDVFDAEITARKLELATNEKTLFTDLKDLALNKNVADAEKNILIQRKRLTWLEDLDTIIDGRSRLGVLSNLPGDINFNQTENGVLKRNLPRHLQPDLHKTVFNIGMQSSCGVVYDDYANPQLEKRFRLAQRNHVTNETNYYEPLHKYKSELEKILDFFHPSAKIQATVTESMMSAVRYVGTAVSGMWSATPAKASGTPQKPSSPTPPPPR